MGIFFAFVGKRTEDLTKADMQTWKADLAGRYCENSMVPMICAVNCYMVNVVERPELKMQAPRWVEKDVIPLNESEVKAFLKEAQKPLPGYQ